MARVPLIQEQDHPEFADAIEKYRAGRRGKLINIYRMLLNAPPLAESWFNHSNTVRLEDCNALTEWDASNLFSDRERAALAYADTMTREIVVPDDIFAAVERHFDVRQIVELTVLIGTYNMNARVLQALRLDLEPLAS